jgi:hypothetical protein
MNKTTARTTQIEIKIPPIPKEYADKFPNRDESFITALWNLNIATRAKTEAPTGQAILNYCHQQGYTKPLEFVQWYNGNVVANDQHRTRFLVVGSWTGAKYVLRSILKKRQGAKSFQYSLNGQAGNGAIQVAYIAEEDSVHFPQIEEIEKNYLNHINLATR